MSDSSEKWPGSAGGTTSSGMGSVPARGRLLGLDYGSKRVGIAVCNPDQTIATPVETYHRRDERQDARFLAEKARENGAVGLVVGLPVHMSGDEGEKAREARAFGEWAGQATGLPVCFFDERYTTAQADEYLREAQLRPRQRQAKRDMLAAQILLQGYLDSANRSAAPGGLRG